MIVHGVTIFLGAFLLFQAQPLLGKYLLPWFGGGPSVWTVCMLFFQVGLLGGYAYAHLLSRLRLGLQIRIHLFLLAVTVMLLPIMPSIPEQDNGVLSPTWQMFHLLSRTIGFTLSSPRIYRSTTAFKVWKTPVSEHVLWTDDYSNLLAVMKQ